MKHSVRFNRKTTEPLTFSIFWTNLSVYRLSPIPFLPESQGVVMERWCHRRLTTECKSILNKRFHGTEEWLQQNRPRTEASLPWLNGLKYYDSRSFHDPRPYDPWIGQIWLEVWFDKKTQFRSSHLPPGLKDSI